jgi:molybdopterin synthase catalytic subunit
VEVKMSPPPAFRITSEPLALDRVVELVAGPGRGAIAIFAGTVRDHHRGKRVTGIEYHAYAEMAERVLGEIGDRIEKRYDGCRVAIHHRVGPLQVGDASVMIAVASPHRREALAGCAAAIEELKSEAPIWKKEFYEDGASWLEGPGSGSTGA